LRMRRAVAVGVTVYLVFGLAVWSSPATRRSVIPAPQRIQVRTFKHKLVVKKKEVPKTVKPAPEVEEPVVVVKAAPKRVPRTKRGRKIRRKQPPKAAMPKTVVLRNTTLEGPIVVHAGEEDVLGSPSVIKTPESSTPPDEPKGEGPATSSGTAEQEVELKFVAPRVVKRVEGRYPRDAPRLGRTVRVILSLKIGKNGRVTKARIVQRPAGMGKVFDAEAIRVAKATKFKPARRGAAAVEHRIRYVVEFTP
ncbi:MAG TPA: TonB family protein, partial [Myxococcales bacterium]|nr:TonB family protein [Myxococcales bacterium]